MQQTFSEDNKGLKAFSSDTSFALESGVSLPRLHLVYETYGNLSPKKDNVILVHHALSSGSHVQSHTKNPEPGWWEGMIGPGLCLDTNKYFVICINNLGSCFGSLGSTHVNPETNKPYGPDFPAITFYDIANSQRVLLAALGITHLHAIVAYSMGAMISMAWLQRYPDSVSHLISASHAYKAYPTNIANRALQRDIIQLDPAFNAGRYQDNNALLGFKLARKLGMLTYRTPEELNQRFNNKIGEDALANYLQYKADQFANLYDANSFITMLDAMDAFDLAKAYSCLTDAFKMIKAKSLIISVDSDILYPPIQQHELYHAMKDAGVDVSCIEHHSYYGHDAFVLDKDDFTRYITRFLK